MQLAGRGAMGKKWGGKVLEKAALPQFLAVICCRINFVASSLVFACKVAGGRFCLCSWVGKAAWFLGTAALHSVIKKSTQADLISYLYFLETLGGEAKRLSAHSTLPSAFPCACCHPGSSFGSFGVNVCLGHSCTLLQ